MKITAIGRGSAFAPMSIGNSSFLFEEDGKFMAFDFGTTIPYILRDEMGFDLGDIDALYLTHAHSDHIGGVGFLSHYRYWVPNKSGNTVRPKLFVHSDFIQPLWCHSLKGDLDGHHGKTMGLTDYYECCPVKDNKSFEWQGIVFQPFETLHINCGFMQKASYGLFVRNPKTGKTAMFTGDTVFNPYGLNYLYMKSDYIFHDCETSKERSNVHANIVDLRTLDSMIKEKIHLIHWTDRVDSTGFAGFVEKGQVFEI